MIEENVRTRNRGLRRGNNIQEPRFVGLRQRLLVCFAATALVYLAITAVLIWGSGNYGFPDGILASLQASMLSPTNLPPNGRSSDAIVSEVQKRIIVFVASVTFCVTGTLFLVVWKILKPLGGMVDAAKAITAGNLGETIPVRSHDELGMLGELLNDVAANFQEILLLVWNHTASSTRALQEIKTVVARSQSDGGTLSGITAHLTVVQEDLHAIQEVARTFQFYRVTLGQEDVTRSD
jgi:methyl-accepting chemotaxis protein